MNQFEKVVEFKEVAPVHPQDLKEDRFQGSGDSFLSFLGAIIGFVVAGPAGAVLGGVTGAGMDWMSSDPRNSPKKSYQVAGRDPSEPPLVVAAPCCCGQEHFDLTLVRGQVSHRCAKHGTKFVSEVFAYQGAWRLQMYEV